MKKNWLKNLEILSIYGNEIKILPSSLFKLNGLKVLRLDEVSISSEDKRLLKKMLPDTKCYLN
jgi:Leucine-rich repeat (LRR) protein|tara:strand:+ start:1362 stop:1550 length:189 start_codon:yes stop_codon:yes gene_type:complete